MKGKWLELKNFLLNFLVAIGIAVVTLLILRAISYIITEMAGSTREKTEMEGSEEVSFLGYERQEGNIVARFRAVATRTYGGIAVSSGEEFVLNKLQCEETLENLREQDLPYEEIRTAWVNWPEEE